MSDFVLHKLEALESRVSSLEKHEHEPGYHEHLLDGEELAHHHAKLHAPAENRKGERRAGSERRTGAEDTREAKDERRAG